MTASHQHTRYILIYSTRPMDVCTYTHRSTLKKILANAGEYSQAHKSTVPISKVEWKMALTQISVNIHCLFQIMKHPFQSGKLGGDKFPLCSVFVCNNKRPARGPGAGISRVIELVTRWCLPLGTGRAAGTRRGQLRESRGAMLGARSAACAGKEEPAAPRARPARADQERGFLTAPAETPHRGTGRAQKDERLLDKLWVRNSEHLYYFKVNFQEWEIVFGFGTWKRVRRTLKDVSWMMWKTGFKSHPLECKTNHLANSTVKFKIHGKEIY